VARRRVALLAVEVRLRAVLFAVDGRRLEGFFAVEVFRRLLAVVPTNVVDTGEPPVTVKG